MRRAIFRLLQRLFTRKPTKQLSKPIVKKKQPKQDVKNQQPSEQKEDRYWRDRISAEDERRSSFYEKYRSRLEEGHDQSQGRQQGD